MIALILKALLRPNPGVLVPSAFSVRKDAGWYNRYETPETRAVR